ncbi:TPA: QVPTGV class sortase B protein-sorting domain-containing protein, partial [Streptococcus equi subsp. zooepidemicus]|nr:QVPTGV class sortase B protein-sorting domain-containing protein [Streptococcus equi subsp. zooepidemicus]
FSSVQFDRVGIYRYVVTENKGNVAGISYSGQKYTVDVYVLNEGDTVKAKYIVSQNENKEKEPIKFKNQLKTTSLKVKKSVAGNAGDRSEKFKFTLTVNPSTEYEAGSSIKVKIQSKHQTEEKEIKIGTPFDFDLADADTALIDKLPVGVTYTVNEVADGYVQSATLLDGTDTKEYKLGGDVTSDETNDEITVTNTKNVNTPTGVAMTIAPYAAVTLVGVGGALYLLKKKKA